MQFPLNKLFDQSVNKVIVSNSRTVDFYDKLGDDDACYKVILEYSSNNQQP